jgi:hypothetical protein
MQQRVRETQNSVDQQRNDYKESKHKQQHAPTTPQPSGVVEEDAHGAPF